MNNNSGDYMKKLLLLFFLFLLVFLGNKKNTMSVFITDNNDFNFYVLSTNLSTKTLSNYLNDEIKIISLYPSIKLNYNSDIKSYKYDFMCFNYLDDINKFINEYRNLLYKNKYNNDASIISFEGIKLRKIVVYTNLNNVNRLIESNKFKLTQ